MPFTGIFKLVRKALKFTLSRPLQRFNIENRAKKYLGPDAKYFMPSPRAIGQLSSLKGKLPQYPHLEAGGGFKNISKRRQLEAITKNGPSKATETTSPSLQQTKVPKSFSESEEDDELVRIAAHQIEVMKTVTKIAASSSRRQDPADVEKVPLVETNKEISMEKVEEKSARPLPKNNRLDMSDLTSIWVADKPPPGRLNLNMLQELMINKLADNEFWTPKEISNRYKIREDYAESLIKYMKQVRIIISPRMAKNLDIVGLKNENYQAAKHIIYHVDKRLRTEFDKQHDRMFLPGEELDEEVRNLIDDPKTLQALPKERDIDEIRRLTRRPEPLKISPLNKPADRHQVRPASQVEAPKFPPPSPPSSEKGQVKPIKSSSDRIN